MGLPSFLPAAPVVTLALAGLWLWRRSWRTGLLAYAGFSLQLATMAATYASERQRLSLWPFQGVAADLVAGGSRE